MNKKDFLYNMNNGLSIQDQNITEDITDSYTLSSREGITIDNCTFSGFCIFPKIQLNYLTFKNCRLKSLMFQEARIQTLTIEGCTIEDDLKIDRITQVSISIIDNLKIKNILIINSESHNIAISNNQHVESLTIQNADNKNINIVNIANQQVNNIDFLSNVLALKMKDVIAKDINFGNNGFQEITFDDVSITSRLTSNTRSLLQLNLNKCKIAHIEINSSITHQLSLHGSKCSTIKIKNHIPKIEFKNSYDKPSVDCVSSPENRTV